MRVTLQTIHQKILTNLNQLTSSITDLNEQVSSSRKMSSLSDSPVDLVSALALRSNLSEVKQYQDNIDFGSSIVDASADAFGQIKDGLVRGRTLALSAINSALSVDNKKNMAEEIKNIFNESVRLGNTQIKDKYIFGGYRTSGYTETEPAPFVIGYADGYRINGQVPTEMDLNLSGTVDNTAIAAGDLAVNGVAVGAINNGAVTNGLNMAKAANAATAINGVGGVTAKLTTLLSSTSFTAQTSNDPMNLPEVTYDFDINGVSMSTITMTGAQTAAQQVDLFVNAINSKSEQTGVIAEAGNGTNGGVANGIVLKNTLTGNDAAININNFTRTVVNPGDVADTLSVAGNFANALTSAANATHNTGQISLSSTASFVLTSPNNNDDTILNTLGLGGGSVGFADEPGDGELIYGSRLAANALEINGIAVPAATADGRSDVFADGSAGALANAINSISEQTGVNAVIMPARRQASGSISAGTIDSGDLIINGVNIFSASTVITPNDSDNTLINAINAQSDLTGVVASLTKQGQLILTTTNTATESDTGLGRNLHIVTSAKGESICNINSGGPTAVPNDKVYFGSLQLRSQKSFFLETPTTTSFEPGLAAIGLAGGEAVTGEANDLSGDGMISVFTIAEQDGSVRYAGDRENEMEVKVGRRETMAVSQNGQEALLNTGAFSALKRLERYLRGENYTEAISAAKAADTTTIMSTGNSGLYGKDDVEKVQSGSFKATVLDHAYEPPKEFSMEIEVDVDKDSLNDIAGKIDKLPGITAKWNNDGYLEVTSSDPDRYSFDLTDDSSNFLKLAGLSSVDIQNQALSKSLVNVDTAMQEISSRAADFGARANRITIQNQIYSSLELATTENLSVRQDTDIVDALMKLQIKQTTYQAALATASKIMQISLVNYI